MSRTTIRYLKVHPRDFGNEFNIYAVDTAVPAQLAEAEKMLGEEVYSSWISAKERRRTLAHYRRSDTTRWYGNEVDMAEVARKQDEALIHEVIVA